LLLSIAAGHDNRDSTSLDVSPINTDNSEVDTGKIKIGVPKEYFSNLDTRVSNIIWDNIKKLESMGASYREISLPYTKHSIAAYYIIASCEASTNLAKFSGMRYGKTLELSGNFNKFFSSVRSRYFGPEAKRRIILGTFARMAGFRDQYYLKALKVRTLIIREFRDAFKDVDVLITPTMPGIAPKFTEIEKLRPIDHYLTDMLTVAPNLAGIPQLSVPGGTVKNMPVGLQILGDHLSENKVIGIGKVLEELK
jgi:aspartyl-tRNA(Asn)/glutamyl-tRNA(Gln) amidotransferase subunit A